MVEEYDDGNLFFVTDYWNRRRTPQAIEEYLKTVGLSERTYRYFQNISKEKLLSSMPILYSYIMFSRVFSFSKNIKDVIKSSEKIKNWDHNLLFVVSRSLIESVEMLFYLCFEDVSQQERDFRVICLLLHEFTDLKNKYADIEREVKSLSELDAGRVRSSVLDADDRITALKELMKSNKFFQNIQELKNRNNILRGQCKYYHPKYFNNTTKIRYYIENKINILPISIYKLIYHRLSFGVHPFNISLEPSGYIMYNPRTISALSKQFACDAILSSRLYLRYSTEQIIHKILLKDMKNEFSDEDINQLEMIASELQKSQIHISNKDFIFKRSNG